MEGRKRKIGRKAMGCLRDKVVRRSEGMEETEQGLEGTTQEGQSCREHIPNGPQIVRPMPTAPKPKGRVIIRNTTNHILRRVHAVHKCPKAEETPRYQQLHNYQHFFSRVFC